MSNGIVAIYDSDVDYLHHLSEYLRSRDDFPYDVIVFSDLDSLENYSRETIDILITSHIPEFIKDKQIGDIFYLSDNSTVSHDKYVCLFKYQPADILLRKIMEESHSQPKADILLSKNKCSIIGVYSPINRCGKTTLSLCLGTNLAKQQSTLLISFDSFSIINSFVETNSFRDISDLLFYFKEDNDNFKNKLLSVTETILELNFICPPATPERLKTIDSIIWCELIKGIADTGLYTNIILDISDAFFSLENFFKLCDFVFLPQLNDYISMEKINSFLKCTLHTSHIPDSFFKRVSLPEFPQVSSKASYVSEISQGPLSHLSRKLIAELKYSDTEVNHDVTFC